MKDIGFGIIDRRTVIVILISMVLASILYGFQIPIRTTSVEDLFVDLIIITGYFYLARSIYRLPLGMLLALIAGIFAFTLPYSIGSDLGSDFRSDKGKNKFLKIGLLILVVIISPILLVVAVLGVFVYFVFCFAKFAEQYQEEKGDRPGPKYLRFFLGFLDRVGLVGIAVFATIPDYKSLVTNVGIFGLMMMVVIYVVIGSFSAVIRDEIKN